MGTGRTRTMGTETRGAKEERARTVEQLSRSANQQARNLRGPRQQVGTQPTERVKGKGQQEQKTMKTKRAK